jgi:hypothetical protein
MRLSSSDFSAYISAHLVIPYTPVSENDYNGDLGVVIWSST